MGWEMLLKQLIKVLGIEIDPGAVRVAIDRLIVDAPEALRAAQAKLEDFDARLTNIQKSLEELKSGTPTVS